VYDKALPFAATIKWIRKETRDTWTYAFKINDREREKAYRFRPGQFNMLYVPGIGESAISISSGTSDHDLLHTLKVAGDVTTAISKMNTGDVIGMRGPFGRGWPLEEMEGRNVMVIAGGVGIAPLRSVIRQLSREKRSCPGRDIILYGAKTPKDVVFRDELPRYREMFQVFLTVDKAGPEEHWKGDVGLVTHLIGKTSIDPLSTMVFICGPEVMMQGVIAELLLRGVPGEKIFLSMERNMNCGMGVCGHCFFGPKFVCRDGPVFRYTEVQEFLGVGEA
jgi:NAD(P)H-flavin reductase